MYSVKNTILLFFVFLFTACSYPNYSSKFEFQSTNFEEIIEKLLKKSSNQIFPYMEEDEILLVSNFVETTALKGDTKLSFILTDNLKNQLVSKYKYTVREIELAKELKFGEEGLKVLTRDIENINTTVMSSKYAVVGTYTFTKNQLLLFLKLINIRDGNMLASSTHSVELSKEIISLNKIVLKKDNNSMDIVND